MKNLKEQIKDKIDSRYENTLIRFDSRKFQVGDTVPSSMDWEREGDEGVELNGSCWLVLKNGNEINECALDEWIETYYKDEQEFGGTVVLFHHTDDEYEAGRDYQEKIVPDACVSDVLNK